MSGFRWAVVLSALILCSCASRMSADTLPSGSELPPGVEFPSSAVLAVYMPSNFRKSRFFVGHTWVAPGSALEGGVTQVAQHYFLHSFLVEADDPRPFGLLLAIQPKWTFERGKVEMKMSYRVYGKDSQELLKGEKSYSTSLGNLSSGDGLFNAALRTSQLVMLDLIAKLKPTAETYPAIRKFMDVDPELVVDREKPVVSGTGFFINSAGQVVTAAHVLHDCALIEVKRDGKVLDTRLLASSMLLDLAVIDTGVPAAAPLPLRNDTSLQLGEPVVDVGFPLQPMLAASPNLARGNVSADAGLVGSLGQFQFSAPIQPGSSGGPVVSDGGELLGVTVSTLNAAALIKQGILPQNVNFAVKARYVAAFLKRNKISYIEVPPNPQGSLEVGNRAALGAVVSVACYQ